MKTTPMTANDVLVLDLSHLPSGEVTNIQKSRHEKSNPPGKITLHHRRVKGTPNLQVLSMVRKNFLKSTVLRSRRKIYRTFIKEKGFDKNTYVASSIRWTSNGQVSIVHFQCGSVSS